MIYTFIVLMFGIYLGQEYPQIPSVKFTFKTMMANLNKLSDVDERTQSTNEYNVNDNDENSFGNDNIQIKITPTKRHYSLPLWFSSWWTSDNNSEHEKSD